MGIKRNGFTFKEWVGKYDQAAKFIAQSENIKYRIDFVGSGHYFIWHPEKDQHFEVETDLDITVKENIDKLITTFDHLIDSDQI